MTKSFILGLLLETVILCGMTDAQDSTGPAGTATAEESRSSSEDFWPGFMGPARNGWVDYQAPANWPKELQKVWQVEVGTGYSSPLVADGHVFQHARQGEDEVLWCFDLNTGKAKWKKSYAVPFKMGGGGEKHGKGPKSSPFYADGRIFTMSITGVLSAWSASSGQLLWQRDFASRFGKTQPYWGVSTSPIVDGNRVIVHFGNDDEGVLVAFDAQSGNRIWSQGNDGASYSSPLVVDIDGVRQVVEWNHRAVVGVDVETGNKLWEFPFPHAGNNQNMPTPAFFNGIVLVGGENRGIKAIKPKRAAGKWSVDQLWHQEKVALDMSTAVVNGNRLYGMSHYGLGRAFGLDIASGEVLWQTPGREGENIAFLAFANHILALVNNGSLQVLKLDGEYVNLVATYRVAESETWAPPVLLSNGLLVKDERALIFWSLQSEAIGTDK